MEEDKTDADEEVQTRADRNRAETDRSGGGEREVAAAGLQGGWGPYSGVLSMAEGIWGLKVEQAKRLKALEKENTRLKRLVAELPLEKQVLQDVAEGNF